MTKSFVILGSGMAGMGAASRFAAEGQAARVFDKKAYPGGHTATHCRDGFVFDEGPHVSFTKHEKIRKLFARAVRDDFLSIDAYIDNYWQGRFIRHPVITNLRGLPDALIVKCINDYVEAKRNASPRIDNYEDWLIASYGRTYAEAFPFRYTEKYHTTTASNMSTDWVGPRLYQAKLEEVLQGALARESPNIHYVQDYRYPRHGGFAAFLREMHEQADIYLDHEMVEIEPNSRIVRFRDGSTVAYDGLVSSIPLPDLIPCIKGAPLDVRDAAQLLACTSVVLVNLGVDREGISKASWTYFYDRELPFSRVSFPRTFSPNVAPSGCGSIQAEIYFSRKYRPLETTPSSLIQPTVEGLKACGILRDSDRIVFQEAMLIPYANIIFDLDRKPALERVHGYLDDVGISYCGRYGDWGYLWTDEAFLSGENAAQKILNR